MLTALSIENFRNLQSVTFTPGEGLNLICGPNAAGKTSLLEAIYLLGRARSFRTNRWNHLVEREKTAFQLVATLAYPRTITLGMKRAHSGWEVRYDGNPVTTLTDLAHCFPVLLLNPDSHRLIEGSPSIRRRFLDWGLFYFDKEFLNAWRRWSLALRQRNEMLRAGGSDRQLAVWEKTLVVTALDLDKRRQTFADRLSAVLSNWIGLTLGELEVSMEYRRGWPLEADLGELLAASRGQDRRFGYTRSGPQRADLGLRIGGRNASEVLSRGQQKLFAAALVLAQAALCERHSGLPCVILVDDLPAELDSDSRRDLLSALSRLGGQRFITAVDPDALDLVAEGSLMTKFRLKAGELSPVL